MIAQERGNMGGSDPLQDRRMVEHIKAQVWSMEGEIPRGSAERGA